MGSPRQTMHAQLLTAHGGVDKYVFRTDLPIPNVPLGHVRVRVHACGMNNTDVWTRVGAYGQTDESGWQPLSFPRIQGADVAGTVDFVNPPAEGVVAVGGRGTPLEVGQRVLVYPCLYGQRGITDCRYLGSEVDGGFAGYCVVPIENVFPVDPNCALSDVELASIPTAYMTAYHMVLRARVAAGETVVVTGAAGGVGVACVELCKLRGARVVAVAAEHKEGQLRSIGADAFVPRPKDGSSIASSLLAAAQGADVDVALDVVGGAMVMDLFNALKPEGRYASCGAVAGTWVNVHWPTLYLKHLDVLGCMLATREEFGDLVSLVEKGALKPHVARVFSLEELPAAQEEFVKRDFFGKFVVDCSQ